jgi:SAM-dependent methyltransferase
MNAQDYDKTYSSGGHRAMYSNHYKQSPYFRIWQHILKISPQPPILDLGCGVGQFAHFLYDNNIRDYHGIDFSKEALRQARARLPSARFTLFDLANGAPITTGTTIILEVLEHLEKDLELIKSLSIGANIIFSVPNFMTAGHVRKFRSFEEVVGRYGLFLKFKAHKIFTFKKATDADGEDQLRTIYLVNAHRFYHPRQLFAYTDGHLVTNDIHKCASAEDFDEKFLSSPQPVKALPFKNMKWHTAPAPAPTPTPTIDGLLESFARTIQRIPDERCLFLHSSGADSRIISGTMAASKRNWDHVHFRLIGTDEAPSFTAIMKRCGFKYDIIPETDIMGHTDISTWGWNSYTSALKFWEGFEPSETILIGGALGEVLYQPVSQWYENATYFSTFGAALNRSFCMFKDTIYPMLEYDTLRLAAGMPNRNKPHPTVPRDTLRVELITRLGMHKEPIMTRVSAPPLTAQRRSEMISAYRSGKFFKKYKIESNFFPPALKEMVYGYGPRLWGFAATTYEKMRMHSKSSES